MNDAPGIRWSRRYPQWRPGRKYLAAGYPVTSVQLTPGQPDDEHQPERIERCHELNAEMMAWWEAREANVPPRDTIDWLIHRYLSDRYSPFAEVKANTQQSYRDECAYWRRAAGHMWVRNLTFETVKTMQHFMRDEGRSPAFIRRKFSTLRILTSYGEQIDCDGAIVARGALATMRFAGSPQRAVVPSRSMVEAVVEKATVAGDHAFAVGVLLQYEFALRGVDVRGQWLPNGKWADGLTWDMFDADVTGFAKVISKTRKSLPEPIWFPLDNLPDLRARLLALPGDRVGPVIVSPQTGQPYTLRVWTALWKRFAKAAGVPPDVRPMDLRAGAITEADRMGADRSTLSQAAQHTQIATTARYVRARSQAVARVVEIRRGV